MEMTKEKYRTKFRTITYYEKAGALICLASAGFILFNINKLDTLYLLACGVFAIHFSTVLPLLVLRSLKRIQQLDIANLNYKDTLLNYAKAKTNLLKIQRYGIFASLLYLVAFLPTMGKIINNRNLFLEPWGFVWKIGIMGIFLLLFPQWGYGHYKRITNSVEHLIKDLE